MKTKKQKGFTLVELLIVIVLTLIVFLGAGSVLAASHTLWNKAWNNVNFQRDASYAMLVLNRPIKSAINATAEEGGAAIRISRKEGDWIRFFLVPEADELQYQIEGYSPQTIIGSVVDLEFNVDGNRVRIDLELKKDKDSLPIHLVSTILMRNYGG